jgi:hypothetical protein
VALSLSADTGGTGELKVSFVTAEKRTPPIRNVLRADGQLQSPAGRLWSVAAINLLLTYLERAIAADQARPLWTTSSPAPLSVSAASCPAVW